MWHLYDWQHRYVTKCLGSHKTVAVKYVPFISVTVCSFFSSHSLWKQHNSKSCHMANQEKWSLCLVGSCINCCSGCCLATSLPNHGKSLQTSVSQWSLTHGWSEVLHCQRVDQWWLLQSSEITNSETKRLEVSSLGAVPEIFLEQLLLLSWRGAIQGAFMFDIKLVDYTWSQIHHFTAFDEEIALYWAAWHLQNELKLISSGFFQ